MLQLVVPTTQKKIIKAGRQILDSFQSRRPTPVRVKGSQLDTKGCRCVNLDESASEVEDKRSGSLEGSAKAQLRRVINGSVSENRRRAGCDTAANCRRFKSSFDSFVIFSGFSGRMERSTNRCCSHVGAFPPPLLLHWEIKLETSSPGPLGVLEMGLDWEPPTFIMQNQGIGL